MPKFRWLVNQFFYFLKNLPEQHSPPSLFENERGDSVLGVKVMFIKK